MSKIVDFMKNMFSSTSIHDELYEDYPTNLPAVFYSIASKDPNLTPKKAHETDSGFDLFSNEDITIPAGEWKLVHTGVKVGITNKYEPIYLIEMQIRPKSGLASKKGISVLNTPGTVDQGYTGEICVIMYNAGKYPYEVKKYDKIAQAVFSYVPRVRMIEVADDDFKSIEEEKDRGANGFGSTGIRKE